MRPAPSAVGLVRGRIVQRNPSTSLRVERGHDGVGTQEIFEAFPAQLGLGFRVATEDVDYLVVDGAKRPTLDAR